MNEGVQKRAILRRRRAIADASKDERKTAARVRREEMLWKSTRCFWSWPIGHVWKETGFPSTYKCEVCGVEKWTGGD